MEKYYYAYSEFLEDTKNLVQQCKDYKCDVLLGISRGGLTISHFMEFLNLSNSHYEQAQ